MMERQLAHMVRLIDDLLDISRISQNKMDLRRSAGDCWPTSWAAPWRRPGPLIEAAGHELTVSLPPEPVYLDADLTRLAQVFSNLLTNSAKYTERGGRIWLTAERAAKKWSCRCGITGSAFPPKSLANIFDMFSQVDRSIERSTGGLGIGLALVKGLVEMHGGTVTAASEGEGRGSTFTVTLPVDGGSSQSPRPRRPTAGRLPPGRSGASLWWTTTGTVPTAWRMMLRLMGDEVRTAHDGIEAVEQAEVFRPEIVLMDVGMPRLNGLDATRRIREQEWGGALPSSP